LNGVVPAPQPGPPAYLSPPVLTDGVVRLRLPTDADLPDIVAACQDPEVSRWTLVPSPYGEADGRAFLAGQAPGRAAGTDVVLAVEEVATGRFVGLVGLHGIADGDAEIGYWTGPWGRGRGLTTRAVRLACGWALGGLGLQRVGWAALVGNDASRRVAEKAGFRVLGALRRNLVQRGTRVDGWVGDLLAEDLP
jgi:RimJ/RimL family protein N-acetyltransferase